MDKIMLEFQKTIELIYQKYDDIITRLDCMTEVKGEFDHLKNYIAN